MHILQPKHTKLGKEELAKLLAQYNISVAQLPKIFKRDPALPEGIKVGEVVKIERKTEEGFENYYRVVV